MGVVSCLWWWLDWASYNLEPTIVNHFSLECRNIVLHISILIPQLNLLWVVHPTIGLMLLLSWESLHMSLHLVLLEPLLLDLFCGLIHIVLVASHISFCWISVWRAKCILVNLLDLFCLVLFQFFHCPVLWFLLPKFS